MSFEAAFRQFLSKFQISGEVQMIDRVMKQFGRKF
jgi:Sec7-like guanine-nucleotide exchange factor